MKKYYCLQKGIYLILYATPFNWNPHFSYSLMLAIFSGLTKTYGVCPSAVIFAQMSATTISPKPF